MSFNNFRRNQWFCQSIFLLATIVYRYEKLEVRERFLSKLILVNNKYLITKYFVNMAGMTTSVVCTLRVTSDKNKIYKVCLNVQIIFGWPICLNNFDQKHFVYQDGPRSERLRAMISSCTKSLKAAIRLEWRSSSG